MTIEWFDPEDKLPEGDAECLVMPHDDGQIITTGVFGPIAWHETSGAWLDLFRDPEAGTIIYPKDVGCWTLWDAIKPPEGLPTAMKETPDGR